MKKKSHPRVVGKDGMWEALVRSGGLVTDDDCME